MLPGRRFAVISTPFKGNLLLSDDMGREAAATCDCHSHVQVPGGVHGGDYESDRVYDRLIVGCWTCNGH